MGFLNTKIERVLEEVSSGSRKIKEQTSCYEKIVELKAPDPTRDQWYEEFFERLKKYGFNAMATPRQDRKSTTGQAGRGDRCRLLDGEESCQDLISNRSRPRRHFKNMSLSSFPTGFSYKMLSLDTEIGSCTMTATGRRLQAETRLQLRTRR